MDKNDYDAWKTRDSDFTSDYKCEYCGIVLEYEAWQWGEHDLLCRECFDIIVIQKIKEDAYITLD